MLEPKSVSSGKAMYRELQRYNAYLLRQLRQAKQEIWELEEANANLRVELEAGDGLLGEAMDQLLDGKRP